MRKIEGNVRSYTPISVRNVQFEIHGSNLVIDLCMDQPWVLKNGDHIAVVGEDDGRSGTFHGYAYCNHTRKICGQTDRGLADGVTG